MTKLKAFVVFGAVVAAIPAGATNLVANGSFEKPGGTVRDGLTTNYLPGWTYSDNGTGLDIYEDDSQDGLTAADGNHYVSFGHSGTYGGSLTQTFATTAGHAYRLALSTAEQQGDDASQKFYVLLTTSVGNMFGFYIGGLTSTFSTTIQDFFPNGVSTTLSIADATPVGSGGPSNLALDKVSVVDLSASGAVPEPAIWASLVAGFAFLGAAMRRRNPAIVAA
jgi:hypothetical protein